MDKNYSVDDILSEIKRRKAEQAGRAPARPDTAAPPPATQPVPPARGGQPPHRPAQPDIRREPEFRFDPAPEPQERDSGNPLDFTGHVRPITDKAKLRPSILEPPKQPPPSQFEFRSPEPAPPLDATGAFAPVEPAAPAGGTPGHPAATGHTTDFRAFRPTGATPPPEQHQTRVLPNFGATAPLPGGETAPQAGVGSSRDKPAGGYYDEADDLDDNLSEHSSMDFSEYNSVADRRDVAIDIARVKLWLFIRLSVTALLTIIIVYLALAGRYVMPLPSALQPEGGTVRAYLILCTVLTAIVALVNSSSVGGGLLSLFKMRANSDSLSTLALLAAVGQGVAGVVAPDRVDPVALSLYFPIATLAMLAGAVGKLMMISRIQANFRIIAGDKPKKALLTVEDDAFCREFVPESTRRPTIAYSASADFFTDFLGLSYSDKYDVGINRTIAPVCLLGSLVIGIICYLLTESSFSAISAFAAVLCICSSLSATFIENIPLGKLANKLTPEGGMVSGNKAVEDFCDTAAVILTETDLFPNGNVRLRGIKTFSQSRIDESIRDAASVMCSLDGDLSPVFLQMIGGDRELLKKVDSVVYENGMGVSAWVDSRRVLIGNRQLMVNHGISIPSDAAQGVRSKNPEESGELLFLSSAGEVTAQFAVSYHIDEDLAAQLDILAARDTTLIVYTTDANITAHHIWELYGYPEELIRILPAERHQFYRKLTKRRENAIAEIVYTGKAAAMAGAIVACVNARSSILYATIIQLVQMAIGYGIVAFMAFMGTIGTLSILQMGLYQLFWFVAILIVQKAKQP